MISDKALITLVLITGDIGTDGVGTMEWVLITAGVGTMDLTIGDSIIGRTILFGTHIIIM
tara:strand:- start:533 stop:712 length:180 start_codon:yes stop_codon:yes gene_type:complete